MFRSMFGDRFFYSLTNTTHPLTPGITTYSIDACYTIHILDMIAEIQNSNLAAMLCDNSDVATMQPAAFRRVSQR